MRYLRLLLFALVMAFTLKLFVVDAVTVPSRSMEPSALPGDYILLDKLGFSPSFLASRVPGRGDVIAFELPPAAQPEEAGALALKRCVAVGGDTLEYRDGTIVVNGSVAAAGVGDGGPFFSGGGIRVVPREGDTLGVGGGTAEGEYLFVIGDNHDVSLDSRSWGCIPARSVVGKAAIVYWSLGADGAVRWSRLGTLVR